MLRVWALILSVGIIAAATGCEIVDPTRPTSHPDTEVFGNLLEVNQSEVDPSEWTVRVQVGVPRALRAAEEEEARPTPNIEKGLVATVTVGADSIVVANDRPIEIDDVAPGTEVVVIPVAGTTEMVGSKDVRVEAAMFLDFETYRRWRLPKLAPEPEPVDEDPTRINSSGSELAPVPVSGGRVLYFSARLRPSAIEDGAWIGARRDGLDVNAESVGARERTYRIEMTSGGWSEPELVRFPDVDDVARVRVTWVDGEETLCLVTVAEADAEPWVGKATRRRAADSWGHIEPLEFLAGGDAHDATYLTGSRTKIAFVSSRRGGQSDIFLYDPKDERSPLPLPPQICTFGDEWNPRTGPQNELYFDRQDRQMAYFDGRARLLRLPGAHRVVFTQAAPTDDGSWIFFCMPKFRPIELDDDIYVTSLVNRVELGEPVPVDEWRP